MMLRPALRPPLRAPSPGALALNEGGGYTAEAQALFARMQSAGVTPTLAEKKAANNFYIAGKAGGWLTKLDAFYLLAKRQSATAARLSLISAPAYDLTVVGAPTYSALGYKSDGLIANKLSSTFNPTTSPSPKFLQADAHIGVFSLSNLPVGASTDTGEVGSFGGNAYLGRYGANTGQARGRAANNATLSLATASFPGHSVWTKTSSTVWEAYGGGQDRGGSSGITSALASGTFDVCAAGALAGINQIAAAHWGASLSAAEVLSLNQAIWRYLVDLSTTFLYDAFERADGAPGSPWVLVPAGDTSAAVLGTISGGAMVAADSGAANTAAYFGVDCGTAVKGIIADVEFYGAQGSAVAALISQANGLGHVTDVTANSVHMQFGSSAATVGFWEASILRDIVTYSYPGGQQALDTVLRVGFLIMGDAFLIICADGSVQAYMDSAGALLAGRYGQVENFWVNAGGARVKIHSARFLTD